jgi:glyoxylase-like metal-dependent hydrolase (beta-lactamase superfamily II)
MIIKSYHTGPLAVNCYVVTDEATKKTFMVDPGGHNSDMVNYIRDNDLILEYIILTHAHGDHMGGVPAIREEFPDVRLIACIHDKALLEDAKLNMSTMVYGYPVAFSADKYITDGETMKVGELELKFLHTPGHSPGGMCILAEDVLFSGDTLFEQSIGRTDFPGSSYPEIVKSIHEKLFVLPDDTAVLPGHMGPTTIGFEKENNPFV